MSTNEHVCPLCSEMLVPSGTSSSTMHSWWCSRQCGFLATMGITFEPSSKFGKIFTHSHISTTPVSKRWGVLEGHIGLPALQPLPCLSKTCVGTQYISIPGP